VHKHPGGAEVDLSVMFADVRGSTGIAERMEPEQFSHLMARFYGAAAKVIDDEDGIVDKFVGDSAVALFLPGFAGEDHPAAALAAAPPCSPRPPTTARSPGSRSESACTPGAPSSAQSAKATRATSRLSATP
jgi:class 3 adenylate cyclase